MKGLINEAFKWYFKQRMPRIHQYMKHPHEVQTALLKGLIETTKLTEWGRKYDFASVKSSKTLASRVPVSDYEAVKPYIYRMMQGEKDVLWPGRVQWFSKSSGTTSDKSKFIPVSSQNLRQCHIRGGWDSMTLLYENRPELEIFGHKNLIMGGSLSPFSEYPQTTTGDVSAIMLHHLPWVARPFTKPDLNIALLPNIEDKIEVMANHLIGENIAMVSGVPTWLVVLFRKMLEKTGRQHILEVWPDLQAYMHGGVSFKPYRDQFRQFIPKDDFIYQEIYNASEGFFGAQSDLSEEGMLLFLDNGMYFEFIPTDEWGKEHPETIGIAEVEVGKNYAIVISTNAGLWRYMPGDTVVFTSKTPHRVRISGRTKQFINAFGEEVMVDNTDSALAETCRQTGAIALEYTVAPIYFQGGKKGGHEWLVEFEMPPQDMEIFKNLLDLNLQRINSDYEAKRFKGLALECLRLRALPKGSFIQWMKARGKFGGQNKVPRLSNHREYIDEILRFTENQFVEE